MPFIKKKEIKIKNKAENVLLLLRIQGLFQKFLASPWKKEPKGEHVCCTNTLPLLIKLEILIQISVLISLLVYKSERCATNLKSGWGLKLFEWQSNVPFYYFKTGSSYFIILMLHHQHRSPWSSPATLLYRPLFLVCLQGYILYQHRAVVCRFLLVVLPFLIHVKGSTGVCHLWICSYFSSNFLYVWFV